MTQYYVVSLLHNTVLVCICIFTWLLRITKWSFSISQVVHIRFPWKRWGEHWTYRFSSPPPPPPGAVLNSLFAVLFLSLAPFSLHPSSKRPSVLSIILCLLYPPCALSFLNALGDNDLFLINYALGFHNFPLLFPPLPSCPRLYSAKDRCSTAFSSTGSTSSLLLTDGELWLLTATILNFSMCTWNDLNDWTE